MKFIVEIREVHISTRKVEVPEDTPHENIIRLALDTEEIELEYSHTMAYHNHIVRELP